MKDGSINVGFNLADRLRKLNPDFFFYWYSMVESYKGEINNGPFESEISFTPHNYDNHCIDIYNILDVIIPESFDSSKYAAQNLFILMVAVLFHDYAMGCSGSDELRERHSLVAKNIFLEIAENEDSVIYRNLPEDSWKEYIADIILAHSNVKGEDALNTLDDVVTRYKNDPITKTINVPGLSALLKFADELDITYDRIKNLNTKRKAIQKDSLPHFDKLKLFSSVDISAKNSKILSLKLRNTYYKNYDDIRKNILVYEVYYKVKDTLKEINELVLNNIKFNIAGVDFIDIEIYNPKFPEDNDIIKKIELSIAKKKSIIEDKGRIIRNVVRKEALFECEVNPIIHWIKIKELSTKVVEKKYIAKEEISQICAKLNRELHKERLDQINIKEVAINELTLGCYNRPIIEYIGELISKKIIEYKDTKKYDFSKTIIVGLNFYGALMAAIIGYKISFPFSYVFFDKDENSFENENTDENRFKDLEENLIILVTDVIDTGSTVLEAISLLNKKEIGKTQVIVVAVFHKGNITKENKFIPIMLNTNIVEMMIINDDCILCETVPREDCPLYEMKKISRKRK